MKPWVKTYVAPLAAFIAATVISQYYPDAFKGDAVTPTVTPEVVVVETIVAPESPIATGYPAVFQAPADLKQTRGHWRVFVRDAVKIDPQFQEIDHGNADDKRSLIVLNTSDPCKVMVSVNGVKADGSAVRYDIPVEIVGKKPVPVPPGPGPGPGPGPVPPVPTPPVVVEGPKEIVVIRESGSVDAELNAVWTRLRIGAVDKYLVSKKVDLTIIDEDDEGRDAWIRAVGAEYMPALIVLDSKKNEIIGKLKVTKDTTDADIIKFIQGYGV